MRKKKETPKFPKRVVLAEGYPWANGLSQYTEVVMRDAPHGGRNKVLAFPPLLWRADVPKYRLVLQRIT